MNVSLYQAAAAMTANLRWQEMISDNLASASVPGARKQEMSFSAVAAGTMPGPAGALAGQHALPVTSTAINFQQGAIRPTGNPNDFAIEGEGFFEVQLPNGAMGYTRDGEFHLNAQGQLVTKQGYLVMSDVGPLQFDFGVGGPITVNAAGEVSQGSELRGRLKVVEFNDPQLLTKIGGGSFLADDGRLIPNDFGASQVRQGFLEGSNTSPTTEMAGLLTAMRMFEANHKVLQMQDERMGRAISELGNPN